jgi:flagellar protein FliL
MAKSDDADKADQAKDAPKGKKKLMMIAGVAVLAAAGAYFFLFSGSSSGEPAAPVPGEVVPLEAVTVNLTDGHYLKVGLALQGIKGAHELDGSKALDLAIDQFSNIAVDELAGNEARHHHKEALKERIVEAYHEEVMDIYFTEFVMQ